MEGYRRSQESTAASPSRLGNATPAQRPASAPTASTSKACPPAATTPHGKTAADATSARANATGHAHGTSSTAAQHVLFLLITLYLLAHAAIMVQQAQRWLHGLLAGQPPTMLHTLLVVLEATTVCLGGLLMRAMTRSSTSVTELADRAFVMFSLIIPAFQCLYTAVSPSSWDGERKWWGFQASMTLLSVLFRYRPAHSLLHAISSGSLLTLVNCCGACFHKPCGVSAWNMARCFVVDGFAIQLAGAIAWAASYPLMYRSAKRREVVTQPSPILSGAKDAADALCRSASAAAPDGGDALEDAGPQPSPPPSISPSISVARERPLSGSQRSSGLRQRRQPAAEASTSQAAAANAEASLAGKQQQQQQQQQQTIAEDEHAAHVPLEFLGIHVFRTLGLAPTLHRVDAFANSLADRVNEQLVVRLVCLPIAIHCLAYAVMARLRFLDFDYGCISYDMLFMWMAAWFMLGRDSVTFDMDKALNQLQEQLSTSLRALSKPRQQTVTELVDSVRQQIVGDDSAASGTHDSLSGEDVQLLEPLGEGTFGKVYKGIWRGTIVAIKSMVLPRSAGLRKERMAIMEAAISSALVHPNVLQTFTYSMQAVREGSTVGSKHSGGAMEGARASGAETGSEAECSQAGGPVARGFEVRLITEYMDLGTLRDALDRHAFFAPPTLELDFCSVLDTAMDIARGVQHLHSLNIIHGDLKARNVLLKTCASDPRGFTSKISDFGLSHKMEAEETHVSKLFQGTPTHMAPEVFLHGHQSKAADAYSFGITLWELYTAEHAFSGIAPAMLPQKVAELGERPHFPLHAPDEYAQLAHRCWDPDVHARPSFPDISAALMAMRKAAAGHKPFPSIAERLQAIAEAEQKSLSQELPSAIVLGRQDTKTSTWYQL